MEVYTGYGDKGMADLSHTKNVSKSDDRICLMGSVEELMSHIGLVRVLIDDVDVVRMLEKISETLKKIIDGVSDPYNREFKVSEDRTELLEEEIGRMKEIFSGERLPILPGDSRVAAEIDVTRAVARRAERELALVSVKFGSDTGAKKYMNRLSDYFYVLARYVDVAKIEEKKTDISESVQKSVKAETAGIVANVGVEAVGTVGSSADVAAGTSAQTELYLNPSIPASPCVQYPCLCFHHEKPLRGSRSKFPVFFLYNNLPVHGRFPLLLPPSLQKTQDSFSEIPPHHRIPPGLLPKTPPVEGFS